MDGNAGESPLGTEHQVLTIILVRRPDRRQIPTRRAYYRGGRRAEDRAEVYAGNKFPSRTDEGTRGPGSAIVMGWASLRGTLRRVARSY